VDLDLLRLFVDVTRKGGFAAVARDRDLEPSKVSRAIAGLERDLGFRLFQRTTRQMSPTEAGALYLQRIKPVLDGLDCAREEARSLSEGPSGILRLTTSVAFAVTCIVPLLPAFRAAFPQVQVELLSTDETLDLVADRIDLAIRLGPSVQAGVVASRLMTTRYRVVATPGYLARSPVLRRPADLTDHRCALFALSDYRTQWLFRGTDGLVETVPIAGDLVFSNAFALYAAVKNGMGPALLPDWLVDADLQAGVIRDVFPDRAATATSFDTAAWLIYPSRSYLPAKVRAAIDLLRARLT